MSSPDRGRYLWYELMTTDPESAMSFYGDVVGWGTQAWNGGESPYTMWTAGESLVGGVMTMPDGVEAPPHWIAYVGVPDVDHSSEQAKVLGATVHKSPFDVPEVERIAVLGDPQGAVFAIFKPLQPIPEAEGQSGHPGFFSWHELLTTDHEAAFGFYANLFGWEKLDVMDMGDMGVYQMFGREGRMLGGMYNGATATPAPPHWLYYTLVADLDEALKTVKARGGEVLNGPMEVPGGDRVAQCRDAQGAAFALHARAQA